MDETVFSYPMKVRDYECDMQGIVNNAVYQHYLETARHEFLLSRGLSFAELTARGIVVVVVRAELDYLRPLRSGDSFEVTVQARRQSRLRIEFEQHILSAAGQAFLRARISAAALDADGRPLRSSGLDTLLRVAEA